ncbi:MAG: phosphoenolpyruvate synthase [Deltaproteobacteria bacterium]|nr:phosphoenolpyruvate synthase [Deltaproteobacteria bacterium]
MTVRFGTKAETLERLEAVLKSARVLPQIRMTVKEWEESPSRMIHRIREAGWLDEIPLIVRSSAYVEDSFKESMAGRHLSVKDVSGERAVRKAISKVIQSYGIGNDGDQVFLQPMLQDVALSGVAFSRDPNTGGPYIVVNYDDAGRGTSTVTSGGSNNLKMFYCYKHRKAPSPQWGRIVKLVWELESLLETDSLDIEFAVGAEGHLYLLQARPLVGVPKPDISTERHEKALGMIYRKIKESMQPHPYLHGSKTIYGVMPDWNPAEMIGVRPRPLTLSLYKELITDSIWAYQRDNYGYKSLRSFPLLISFHGFPYIDVRVDFNSFVPADIDAELSERLVNYYLKSLLESPTDHDKVEFEILYTCYTFDFTARSEELRKNGFSKPDCARLEKSLGALTNRIIHGEDGLWHEDLEKINDLQKRHSVIMQSPQNNVSKIYWLLEDCKRYGTLPFAGLARTGFIAVQLLQSLQRVGILNRSEYDLFTRSLNTIGSQMNQDFQYLSRKTFLKKYGHLRPGTYDILSPRYDEEPDQYFTWAPSPKKNRRENRRFIPSPDQLRQTGKLLKHHPLQLDAHELYDFIGKAVAAREYAKFIFTVNVSEILKLFRELGNENGFSPEQCSYADINCIKELYSSSADAASVLKKSIASGQENYSLTRSLSLPPLITKPEDVWHFHLPESAPNFITLQKARGPVAHVHHENRQKLVGSILMIPSADPGYDWVFSRRIAALITMYGGANSHMAVRAGELGVPAVIGAGEIFYSRWAKAEMLDIDCSDKRVSVIR